MPPFSYLTSSFGIAVQHAVRISERVHQGAPISVFEIDTKVLKLALRYPDEDYLREEWNSDFTDWTLKEQLAYMENHQNEWRESLKMMRVIAYKGVIKPSLLRLAPVPRWMEDGYRKRLPRKVQQETLGAAVTSPSPVTLPAIQRALVSSREVFRSSKRSSTAPYESRTKATSAVNLESKPRGSLGGRSRRRRRTRRAVVRVLAYITSDYGSQSLVIRNRKPNFDSLGMNAPTYYIKLQDEFRRLHGMGWTFRQIAGVLDISERTVTAWRKELDLPRRPRGRRPRKSRK
jgi:hypothetical protein